MYAVLYSDESESWIKLYNSLSEADTAAMNMKYGCGFHATVFGPTWPEGEFLKLYTV